MKTDRHSPTSRRRAIAPALWLISVALAGAVAPRCGASPPAATDRPAAGEATEPDAAADVPPTAEPTSQSEATQLLRQVIRQVAYGPAFFAKVRETVWVTGREVVGVGNYEQAGSASGRFSLQITMHDGDGRHQFQQICDGRLAWTRSEIASQVVLRRVDVGRLAEWVADFNPGRVEPRLRIGGWAEMLDSIDRDHILRVDAAQLQDRPVWVISGRLRPSVRAATLRQSGRSEWPVLYPTRVRVAIHATHDPETGFGKLLPARIEFWSDPVARGSAADSQTEPQGRLVTLIELYAVRPIQPPPIERFRFDNQDAEVNFVNETERYLERFGVRLTDGQRRLLRR